MIRKFYVLHFIAKITILDEKRDNFMKLILYLHKFIIKLLPS